MPRFRRRLCMSVDLREYSRHGYPGQADAQTRLRRIVEYALRRARIPRVRTQQQLGGDGRPLIFPAGTDTVRAVPALVLALRDGLHHANLAPGAFGRMRMRAALAQGPVSRGDSGYLGDCVVVASRLVDSPALREELVRHEESDLALALPDDLYRDVVLAQARGLTATDFRAADVPGKNDFAARAWLHTPVSLPARDSGPDPVVWGREPLRDALWEYAVPALVTGGLTATAVAYSGPLREWVLGEADPARGPGHGPGPATSEDFDGPALAPPPPPGAAGARQRRWLHLG